MGNSQGNIVVDWVRDIKRYAADGYKAGEKKNEAFEQIIGACETILITMGYTGKLKYRELSDSRNIVIKWAVMIGESATKGYDSNYTNVKNQQFKRIEGICDIICTALGYVFEQDKE